jgi:hypothetical protein
MNVLKLISLFSGSTKVITYSRNLEGLMRRFVIEDYLSNLYTQHIE